jgi:hypothetical protein
LCFVSVQGCQIFLDTIDQQSHWSTNSIKVDCYRKKYPFCFFYQMTLVWMPRTGFPGLEFPLAVALWKSQKNRGRFDKAQLVSGKLYWIGISKQSRVCVHIVHGRLYTDFCEKSFGQHQGDQIGRFFSPMGPLFTWEGFRKLQKQPKF